MLNFIRRHLPRIRTACFILLLLAVLLLLMNRCFVFDTTAERIGSGFTWRGHTYRAYHADYTGGRMIARTKDNFSVLSVKGDPLHRFLVLGSFLDSQLCVREDYEIPKSGRIRGAYWIGRKIIDPEFCRTLEHLLAEFRTDFTYRTDQMYTILENRQMKDISFCFEDCPVGVDPYGSFLGILDGEWVFAQTTGRETNDDGTVITAYNMYRVPAEYEEIIEPFWIE